MRRASLVAVVVAIAAPAHAATWRWSAPDGCSEAALHASVAARVDRSVEALPLDVDVAITGGDGGFTATLVVGGAIVDTRTLTSASCGELTDAIAIVIARLASVVAAPPVPVVAPPPAALVEMGPIVARTVDDRPRGWNGGARISGIVGTGGAPALGIAADFGVWAQWRSVSLEIAVSRWKSNMWTVGNQSMSGVDVGLDSMAARAGWRRADQRIRTWIVGEIGSMEGTGVRLDGARSGSARWSALGGGGALAWPVADRVSLIAAGELEFLIDRVRFELDGGSLLYQTPPVAVRASLGVEVGWR